MNDPRLPANPNEWPSSPYQILGVPETADAAELRRAYTRCVREYRPDDSPAEFQKIREAYEKATQWLQWRRVSETDEDEDETDPAAETEFSWPSTFSFSAGDRVEADIATPQNDSARDEEAARRPFSEGRPPSVARSHAERLDDAWNAGRDGQTDAALSALKSLVEERPSDPEAYLRLYWLHLIVPELDPEGHPADWLIEGLRATALSPRLLSAYRDELNHNPLALLSEQKRSLLEVAAPSHRRVEAASARWPAAVQLYEWEIIDRDLDLLKPDLSLDDPDAWARALFQALDYSGWSSLRSGQALAERCRVELRGLRDRELALAPEFDRAAFLNELTSDAALLAGNNLYTEISRFIRDTWIATNDQYQRALIDLADNWISSPAAALNRVSKLTQDSIVVFEQLWRAVNRAFIPWEMRPHSERTQQLAARLDFVARSALIGEYSDCRNELLAYFIHEMVWPEEMAEHLTQTLSDRRSLELAQFLQGDLPLQCVHLACMAFLIDAE